MHRAGPAGPEASTDPLDPLDPLDAQQIVIEYARLLERDISENRHPARVDSLPYAKPIIKSAIRTSATQLAASGQLSDELRDDRGHGGTPRRVPELLRTRLITLDG
ncbi:MAG: hypothetical protein ACM3SQ_17925 [Betaproteobacteria bacterium]